ncbi:AAA family ATPase [Parageobacillus toebii NBRC 107807]|uniref:Uncharacterized protein YhaN n=2 Tax=Parageobacillus TaxID=1906945 RepID=A0A6G9J5Z1_9BACL|nr:uncharacterized protein YhaN [Parageobacillus toebii NBRC 107807]OXB91845.1 hypothetical protein B9L23_11085 [Parageobacillus galactosidasius]QIQ33582.1 AAA family ATPase [Parageobacillus toebii NBRC 107807]
MRIRSIGIQSVLNYGAFELDFGEDDTALHILYGPNEAGIFTYHCVKCIRHILTLSTFTIKIYSDIHT